MKTNSVNVILGIALLVAGTASADWQPVKTGKLRGIGGLEPLVPSGEALECVIVHDNKRAGQNRVAVIEVHTNTIAYQPLSWPTNVALPVDLEALATVPDSEPRLFWAMTSKGRVFEIRVVDQATEIAVARQFDLPGVRGDENYEALALQCLGAATVVAWGHRGGGTSPGALYWGLVVDGAVQQRGWHPLTTPWPEGPHVRHISDCVIDATGHLFVSGASDPGDNGPFDGVVYRAGRFRAVADRVEFEPDYQELHRAVGQKIEAVALMPGEPHTFALATDNENGGSTFRQLILPRLAASAP